MTTFGIVASDTWNAELYGSLSVSSRLSAAIKSRTAFIKILWFLHRTNSVIGEMLKKIDDAVGEADKNREKKAGSVSNPTKERVENAVDRLDDLYRILDGIHSVCYRHRLQNASQLRSGLAQLRAHADRINELADWLRDSLNPGNHQEAFARAMREFENGETVPASEVCR